MAERRHGAAGLAVALVVATVVAGGCATLPSGGGAPATTRAHPVLGGGDGGCCGLIVRGPQANWDAQQVVNGFLLASAKPANNFALAREYLVPGKVRNSWRPGSAVTILAQTPKVSNQSERLTEPGTSTVVVTGLQMATLQGSQYTPAASGDQPAPPQDFTLVRSGGRTLIEQVPTTGLLLTDNLFHLVYTARDVYFYGLRDGGLVPIPVFVRADSDLAETLVTDLFRNPAGDLHNAIATDFPPGVRLVSVQSAPGKTAVVSLHLPKGSSPGGYIGWAAQVVATLTSSGYGPRLFDGVKLKINGTVWSPPHGGSVLTMASPQLSKPRGAAGGPVYYVDGTGSVRALTSTAPGGVLVSSRVPLSNVAVSPDGKYLAGVGDSGDTVETVGLKPGAQPAVRVLAGSLHTRVRGVDFTSLSWDNQDDLWLTGRVGVDHVAGIWVLPAGHGSPVLVSVPRSLLHVSAIRVAPDGVRAAMVVGGTKDKAHIVLGYIYRKGFNAFSIIDPLPLGPGLFSVTAMAWFDQDHLVASARPSPISAQPGTPGPAQLWEVPVNGDSATSLHWRQSAVTSIAAAGPQHPLYLTEDGRVLISVALGEPWNFVAAGRAADYPG